MSTQTQAFFQQEGKTVNFTAEGRAYAAGEVVVQGNLVGVTLEPVAEGARGALCVSGVVRLFRDVNSIGIGVPVYWHLTQNKATASSGGAKYIGLSIEASGSDPYISVLLVSDAPSNLTPLPVNNDLAVSEVVTTAAVTTGADLPKGTAAVYLIAGVSGHADYLVNLLVNEQSEGRTVTIVETAGYPALIAPPAGGKIGAKSADAPIAIDAHEAITLMCIDDTEGNGVWAIVGEAPVIPTPATITLSVSGVETTATTGGAGLPAGTAAVYIVKGTATPTDKVVIDVADKVAGRVITLIETAGNAAKIAPPTGGTIDGGEANAVIDIAANQVVRLICVDASASGAWTTMSASPIDG